MMEGREENPTLDFFRSRLEVEITSTRPVFAIFIVMTVNDAV